MTGKNICGLTPAEIIEAVSPFAVITLNQANTIASHIYKKRIKNFFQIPGIPSKLKNILSEKFSTGTFSPIGTTNSSDRSVKYLFRNKEGLEYETVFIPDNKRNTVCVSTQSGCRMGCLFCATTRYGFGGNLDSGEIINQVISLPDADKVNHVVFMGMGEPMDNLKNVLKACEIFTAEWGVAISPRNVTVSTVGIMPEIREFLGRSKCNLVLSLFSPFPEERRRFIPIEKAYQSAGITELIKTFPVKKKRRLSIAYVMMHNINDTDRHLEKLKTEFGGSSIRINLLPYHPVPPDVNLPSSAERLQHFKHELIMSGVSASIRKSRGNDISAACGLLATNIKKKYQQVRPENI